MARRDGERPSKCCSTVKGIPTLCDHHWRMSNDATLSRSAARVQAALAAASIEARVVELPASTRTAAEAAGAIGCQVAQIAKSLIFRGATSGNPILVIASGTNRVNEQLRAAAAGQHLAQAHGAFLRALVRLAA